MYHIAGKGPWFSKSLGVMNGPLNSPNGGDCSGEQDEDFNYFKVGTDFMGKNLLTGEASDNFTAAEIEVYQVLI